MKLIDLKDKYLKLTIKKNLKGNEALEAVKQNGNALRYVKEQTEQICLEAVKQDGNALRYVYESFFENKTELLNPEEIKNKIFELVNKLIGVNNDN